MKVARTVLRGGNFSNKMTYLDRPYAALLLLFIECVMLVVVYKVIGEIKLKLLYLIWHIIVLFYSFKVID